MALNLKSVGVMLGSLGAVVGLSFLHSRSGSRAERATDRKPDSLELRRQLTETENRILSLNHEAATNYNRSFGDPRERKETQKDFARSIGLLRDQEEILKLALDESLANEKAVSWTIRDPSRNFAHADLVDESLPGARRGSVYDMIEDEQTHRARAPRVRFDFESATPEMVMQAKRNRKLR
jgi:hypothetical protein